MRTLKDLYEELEQEVVGQGELLTDANKRIASLEAELEKAKGRIQTGMAFLDSIVSRLREITGEQNIWKAMDKCEQALAQLRSVKPLLQRHMVHEDENEFYQAFIEVKQTLAGT